MHKADLNETIQTLQDIEDADKNSIIPRVHLGTIRDSRTLLCEYRSRRTPIGTELEGGGSSWWHVCPECHGMVDEKDFFCRHCGQSLKD